MLVPYWAFPTEWRKTPLWQPSERSRRLPPLPQPQGRMESLESETRLRHRDRNQLGHRDRREVHPFGGDRDSAFAVLGASDQCLGRSEAVAAAC